MLEDEIMYMGSRPASHSKSNRILSSSQATATATGITLHVEKSGNEEPYRMMFRRANTSVVHIGRRPPAADDADRRTKDNESGRAMFRCPVVSRKHAKIAFSDSGYVYLIDLSSHHGTHVRKPGTPTSKMLVPETPTLLSDGDIITFGKSVGKNAGLVRPVVARVELLYGHSTQFENSRVNPLVVPDSSTTTPPSKEPAYRKHKLGSGRYGVYIPSSPSSDESSHSSRSSAINSDDSRDSDIEELPAPSSRPLQLQLSLGPLTTHIERTKEAVKSLFGPSTSGGDDTNDSTNNGDNSAHNRCPSPFDQRGAAYYSPSSNPFSQPFYEHQPSPSPQPPSDILELGSPSPPFSPVFSPYSPTSLHCGHAGDDVVAFPPAWNNDDNHSRAVPKMYLAAAAARYPSDDEDEHSDDRDASDDSRAREDGEDGEDSEDRSRSNSPMDLASPSPTSSPRLAPVPSLPSLSSLPPLPSASLPPLFSPPGLPLGASSASTSSLHSSSLEAENGENGEPVVIGAWPEEQAQPHWLSMGSLPRRLGDAGILRDGFTPVDMSSSSGPVSSSHARGAAGASLGDGGDVMQVGGSCGTDKVDNAASLEESRVLMVSSVVSAGAHGTNDASPPASPRMGQEAPGETAEIAELKTSMGYMKDELSKLQTHRRKYKARFNANVQVVADKLSAFDERLTDVSAACDGLVERADGVAHFDIPDLQAQIDEVQDRLDIEDEEREERLGFSGFMDGPSAWMPREDADEQFARAAMTGDSDARRSVRELKDLVVEMRTLRENTENQMAAELEMVKAAREAALASIAAAQAQLAQLAQTPVPTASLKRKRGDGEDEDEGEGLADEQDQSKDTSTGVDIAVAESEPDAMQDDVPESAVLDESASSIPMMTTTMKTADGIDVPSPKRARRIASAVVQTATAVTLGAVVTWGALAFS